MTLVLEFAGAPGAGKSTLCRAVASALASAGVAIDDRSLRAGTAARRRRLARKALGLTGAVRRPVRLARIGRACRRSGLAGRELVARTVNLVVLEATCRRDGPEVVVLDQGLVQEVVSVGVTADHRALLEELPPGMWSAVDVVVRLRVPASIAADRLARRGTGESRAEHLDATALATALDGAEAVLDAVLAGPVPGAAIGVEVWEVDGTEPTLTDDLMARISRSVDR